MSEVKIDIHPETYSFSFQQMSASTAANTDVETLVAQLGTSLQDGLSAMEASERLKRYGRNELQKPVPESLVKKFLEKFKEPLIVLLLVSALVSLMMGQYADAIGIFVAITIVNTVGFIQEYRSEKSVEALRSLASSKCHVLRSRVYKEIPSEELVPGDVVPLTVGTRIPADIRLVQTVNLSLDESILTGETEPNVKCAEVVEGHGDRRNMAFLVLRFFYSNLVGFCGE